VDDRCRGELALGNRIIDEAATEAGRYSRDISRIFDYDGSSGQARRGFLQGPPTQWIEELLPLVIELSVSTFILVRDDPRDPGVCVEVAPALRKAVARKRKAAGTRTKEETKTEVARKGGKSFLL
jgi:hypothetical protein